MDMENLVSLFISDPENAIKESQNIICKASHFDTYDEFLKYHREHSRVSTCQNEWNEKRMSIHCFDCANSSSSCVCLKCFLNGNHKGHNYTISPDSIGNCDCGDLSLWKQSGFCKDHQGLEKDDLHPEDYLSSELRTALTDVVFKSALTALLNITNDHDKEASEIINFIQSFLEFGDGFRRLIAISVTEKIDLCSLLLNYKTYSMTFNLAFKQLCGNLINDRLFKTNFRNIVIKITFQLIDIFDNKNEICKLWDGFWFHTLESTDANAESDNWIDFLLELSKKYITIFKEVGNEDYDYNFSSIYSEIFNQYPNSYFRRPINEIQTFLDRLCSEILNQNSDPVINILTTFLASTQKDYFFASHCFRVIYRNILNIFKFQKELKFDFFLEQLDKNIDLSKITLVNKENENDKLILNFNMPTVSATEPLLYYDSFHNGSSFYISHPLYYSFVCIFGLENLHRIKISRLFLEDKFQPLRVKLGQMSLKSLLSYFCVNQKLVSMKNFGLINTISMLATKPNLITLSTAPFIPVLQMLIGLRSKSEQEEFGLKEYFSYEMSRLIGIFDDFESELYIDEDVPQLQDDMLFTFLCLQLILVTDRILFNLSPEKFIYDQVVFALKSGITDLDKITKFYDYHVLADISNTSLFKKVLFNVAFIKQNSQQSSAFDDSNKDISLVLKENVKWNLLTSTIPLNMQKGLINNEISKNLKGFLTIQNFVDEDEYFFNDSEFAPCSLATNTTLIKDFEIKNETANYDGLKISLKDLLMTPTTLGVVYHSMRKSLENVNLNDHLSMNILILISKFIQEKDGGLDLSNKEIKYSTVQELVAKFREEIFNYTKTEDGKATISNTLTKRNFIQLLNMKIGYLDQEPKSYIDLILAKGDVGKVALSQMPINLNLNSENQDDSVQKEKEQKKQKARRLKDEIMNKYKSMISSYSISEKNNSSSAFTQSDSIEGTLSSSFSGVIDGTVDVCSVCSTVKKDEILSYPLFMYKTKMPFIVDKPPLTVCEENEIEVSCDDDSFLIDDDDSQEEKEDSNKSFDPNSYEREIQILNRILEQAVISRQTGSSGQEEFLDTLNFVRQRRQDLEILKEICMKMRVQKALKEQKKAKRAELEKRFAEEKVSKSPKRYAAGCNYVVQFSLCQHLIHPNCIESGNYRCPIDRSMKNSFLPALDFLPSPLVLTNEVTESIKVFLNKFATLIAPSQNGNFDLFTELIKSLCGLISTYEIRLRNLPDCLDSNDSKLLARNLFLTTYYAYRIQGKPPITDAKPYLKNVQKDVDHKLTEFQKFIKALIECDNIESNGEAFSNLVVSFIEKFNRREKSRNNDKELFLFLKRVCLADYFLLGNEVVNLDILSSSYSTGFNDLIVWDEVLSIENISQRFKVDFASLDTDFEFRPFVISKLPKEFLHFAMKPYNFPIEKTTDFMLYNILDYNYLIEHYDDFKDDENDNIDEDEFEKVAKRNLFLVDENDLEISIVTNFRSKPYPSINLLVGKFASRTVVLSGPFSSFTKPFYLDKYGSPDVGFERNEPLFLNEERYERFLDEVFSGEFSNSI